MDRRLPVKAIAACLGLSAFAVAIVSGLGTGAEAADILLRALMCLVGCYLLGLGIGVAADVAIRENLNAFEQANPLKTSAGVSPSSDSAASSPPASPGATRTA